MRARAILLLSLLACLECFIGAQFAGAACTPNGNIFNLEPLGNAKLLSQYNESVAFLLNRSGGGNDLVMGGALDARPLVDRTFPFNDGFYVGRDSSNCAAAVEGGLPLINFNNSILEPEGVFGTRVAADPAHDAFFVAEIYLASGPDFSEVGVLKSTAADLLNTTNCPKGTLQNAAGCFEPFAGGADIVPLNTNIGDPVIAVDQRTTGKGSGDVYVANTHQDVGNSQPPVIAITACTNNNLTCGNPTFVARQADPAIFNLHPWIQVRPDGAITISWLAGPDTVEFATCKPNGAPNPPSCSPFVVLPQPKFPAIGSAGETALFFVSRPVHVNRLESDGKTITTFLTLPVCDVYPIYDDAYICPKASLVVTHSTDGGKTWSPLEKLSNSPGQQFNAAIALDTSTQTVNIPYYSTETDPQKYDTQIFLSQILPGMTSAGPPHRLTSAFFDGQVFGSFFSGYGDHIGVAAAGTGNSGQSKVYVHVNGSPVNGIYNGIGFPIETNTLTRFEY